MISVIVPVYNVSSYLRRCIDALLAQTFQDIEIILINDGSTDNSGQICKEYADQYPEKIRFIDGPNGGVCVARNKGLDAARGEWISFCDSDDYYYPEMCQFLYEQAVRTGAQLSSCALVREYSGDISMNLPLDEDVVWGREDILKRLIHPYLRLGDPVSLKVLGYPVLSLFRRDIVEENHLRFRPGMVVGEDEAFYFEYLQFVQCAALSKKVLYFYAGNPTGACAKFTKMNHFFVYSKRAINWLRRAEERFRVFKAHQLYKVFPEAYPILWLELCYHQMQVINCDKTISFFKKLKAIGNVLKEMKTAPEYPLCPTVRKKKCKLFFILSKLGILPVFLYCKAIQLKNDLSRTP